MKTKFQNINKTTLMETVMKMTLRNGIDLKKLKTGIDSPKYNRTTLEIIMKGQRDYLKVILDFGDYTERDRYYKYLFLFTGSKLIET